MLKGSLAGSALIGLGVLGRFLGFQSEANPPGQYDLGPSTDYPQGSRIQVPEAQVIVIHSDLGYIALSLVCPHLGCEVQVTGDGFACPCHGSRFQADGSLHNGPASSSLTSLRIEESAEGHLILYHQ
jgi:cytochrome b6-f complex iron-sulfur subunit